MKPTIIHISPGAHYDKNLQDIESRHYGSWATPFARKTLEYTDKYDLEIWKAYDPKDYGDHGATIRERDGITFRLFPAKKYGPKYISFPLLKELVQRIKSGEQILIHLQGLHKIMAYLITRQCKNIPLVAQQRGPNSFPMWQFKFRKNPGYLLSSLINNFTIQNFDFVFACSIGETNYIKKKLGADRVLHQKGGGFEFDQYIPRPKEDVRKELGLPLDKKIMIHVGRFTKLKGIDIIIDVYKKLQKKYDLELLFIGGNESQPLYKDVAASGAIVKGYIPRGEVIKYINASDVYLMPSFDEEFIPFGGIGTAPLEALAMNVPVVSPLMVNFMGTKEELSRIAKVPSSQEDLVSDTEEILNNPVHYSNTRDIVMNYYQWENIISNTLKVYNRLLQKYYGGKTNET